jgi:hypothetical protein
MKVRFLLSFLAVVVMLSSIASVSFAQETPKLTKETRSYTNNVVVGKDTLIGNVTITTDSSAVTTKDGIQVTVNITKDYTILPAYQEEYGTIYKDSTDQSVVLISNENELYVNGKKWDVAAFEKAINRSATMLSGDTGGYPAVCHYYSNEAWTSYTFNCYESMNYNWFGEGNGHGEPEGAHISKTGVTPTNTWFAPARNDVDIFDNAYQNYRTAYAAVMFEALGGLVASIWFGGGGLIATGIITAVTAGGVVALFDQAVEAAEDAYETVIKL